MSNNTLKPSIITVYAYAFENEYGISISACLSEEERQQAIYDYVRRYWNSETP